MAQYSSRSSVRGARERFSMTDIFKIKDYQLAEFFKQSSPADKEERLVNTLSRVLSEERTGIIGDADDLKRRKSLFKPNKKPAPKLPPFKESLMDALNDRILLVTACMGFLSMITGMIYYPKTGWISGFFIIVALAVSVLITAVNDYSKDTRFVKLQSLASDEELPVIRGKEGSYQTISIWKMVVGDIVMMEAGDKAPADCLFVEAINCIVDESCHNTDEGCETVPKERGDVLFADSYLKAGSAKVVVCAVGENSTREVPKFDTTDQTSPLALKLERIGGSIKFFGLLSMFAILVCSMIMIVVTLGAENMTFSLFLEKFVTNLTLAFVILIVVIPEGIPMTIGISIAYSVFDMYDNDHLLVRNLNAPEKLGLVNEILIGKTGTMTTEEMDVVSFYIQNAYHPNNRKDTLLKCYITEEIINKIKESIVFNSSAYIEMNENSFYVPVGQGTEVSLFKWLQNAEVPVHEIIKKKYGTASEPRILYTLPFDSTRKFSLVAIRHPDVEDTVRVYVKGAPEVIIHGSHFKYDSDGNKEEWADRFETTELLRTEMFAKGHRGMGFSYQDFSEAEWDSLDKTEGALLQSMSPCFLGVVALHDPFRDNIRDHIAEVKKQGISVRLVSGDNEDTCKAVAIDTGIIPKEDDTERFVMLGANFREEVGPIVRKPDSNGNETLHVRDEQKFSQIMENLRVLARATPEDKLLLTVGLKNLENRVAVVGEGINDVEAFKEAHVSFAMGSGASFARNNASVVLTTNNFESVMKAIMWGRNIYTNMQRFLVFQMTCNIAIVITLFFGNIFLIESPLNAVQLIWINLIMDILGALALASTRPTTEGAREPINEDKLLEPHHYRSIYINAIWMLLMMVLIMVFGKAMFDLEYHHTDQIVDQEEVAVFDEDGNPTGKFSDQLTAGAVAKKEHFTIIWNTFIFLMFFNMINAREVSASKMNMFSNLHRNFMMLFILVLIIAVQWLCCFFWIGEIFEVSNLEETEMFTTGVAIGGSVLLSNIMTRFLPKNIAAKLPTLDESKAIGEDSKLMQAYNTQAQAKVMVKKDKTPSVNASGEDDGYTNLGVDDNNTV